DGGIGKIDEATNEVGASYIVVDTGPWIFGKKVMLPAGVINRVDREEETVYADRTKEQIKNAPEFDPDDYRSEQYRGEVGSYYGRGGGGGRDQEFRERGGRGKHPAAVTRITARIARARLDPRLSGGRTFRAHLGASSLRRGRVGTSSRPGGGAAVLRRCARVAGPPRRRRSSSRPQGRSAHPAA